jgi:hypothetical protein
MTPRTLLLSAAVLAVAGHGLTAQAHRKALVVAHVVVSPDSMTLIPGEIGKATCTPSNKSWTVLTNPCTWTAKDTTVAKPSSGGQNSGVTARKVGQTLVVAVSGGKADTLKVAVRDTTTTTPTPTPPPPSSGGEQAATADSFSQSVATNVHYSYTNKVYGNRALIASLVADLGLTHLRDGGVSSTSPAYMQNIYGPMAALSASQGVRWQILGNPFETNQANWSFTDTRGLDSVAKYLGAANIEAWEGLNEWNSKRDVRPNWAAEDRAWQQTLWSYRAAHPGPRVVGPSFTRYVDACAVGDLTATMDRGNMHPYPAGRPQSASLQANVDGLRCVNGSDPLTATETGYQNALQSTSGNTKVSESIAGVYFSRLWLGNFAAGLRRTYSYELIDQGTGCPTSTEPKPASASITMTVRPSRARWPPSACSRSHTTPGPAFAAGRLSYTLSGDTGEPEAPAAAKAGRQLPAGALAGDRE